MSKFTIKYILGSCTIFTMFLILTKLVLADSPFPGKHSMGKSVEINTDSTSNAKSTKLEGKVSLYKGRNVFFINGKPVPPIMYSSTEQGRKTWADPTKKVLRNLLYKGIVLFRQICGSNIP